MWRSCCAFVLMMCSAAPAVAAEWWWVSSGGERPARRIDFIDKSSATTDYSGRISAWDFTIYEGLTKDGVRKEKALYRFDCRNRTMTLIELIEFGNNDRLIKSYSWNSFEQSENNIAPESVGESKWEFACASKSKLNGPGSGTPEEFAAMYFRISH